MTAPPGSAKGAAVVITTPATLWAVSPGDSGADTGKAATPLRPGVVQAQGGDAR